jgi:glycosyltransferase domain-containing protein
MPISRTLTIVIPTRNRPRHCLAQLRFLRACGVAHPIVIADSSDEEAAECIRAQCAGAADYRFSNSAVDMTRKLAEVIQYLETPFAVMLPDDDITFPHAIDGSVAHLQAHPDYVAAHGYTLRFGMRDNDIDVHDVFGYTPTIDAERPLRRLYDLLRRYQPFFWAVFRTEALALVLEAAAMTQGALLKELAFMSRATLKGKVARLPAIFAMRGMEESLTPAVEVDPILWFLHDSGSFYRRYSAYRDALAAFVRADSSLLAGLPPTTLLEHLLDLSHATLFGRAVDVGMINHQVQLLLGEVLPPIRPAPQWPGWRTPEPGDVIHYSQRADRCYIWRRSVIEAEPRDEIIITSGEIATVEQQLEAYRLDCQPGLP